MTDERRNWYNQILAAPLDDTVRLAFADWLREHGQGDRDAATVEFIQVACRHKGHAVMPRAAYTWIDDNWRRLIPHALEAHPHHSNYAQDGCRIKLDWRVETNLTRLRWIAMNLHFSRGFLSRVDEWSHHARRLLLPALYADQPLARVPLWGAERNARRGLAPLIPLTVDPREAP